MNELERFRPYAFQGSGGEEFFEGGGEFVGGGGASEGGGKERLDLTHQFDFHPRVEEGGAGAGGEGHFPTDGATAFEDGEEVVGGRRGRAKERGGDADLDHARWAADEAVEEIHRGVWDGSLLGWSQ